MVLRFKLHLIINEQGELIAFKLTVANVDDRVPVPDMTKDIVKLFGDKGYISQKLFEELYERGLQLVTKRNMKKKCYLYSTKFSSGSGLLLSL